ncbi:MAG: 4Fe-4S dicluster domain-containing protein [Nitrospirae bacterium]|nr:4Fe-4S dicluster domain-containing protein [Nitrospirota bacterium]
MSNVYNWHLGREMSYPYEERHPKWQFAAVFNTNRCIACQTCSMACKSTWTAGEGQEYMWWNNVETKPYGGYPQGWDVKVLKLLAEEHRRQEREMMWEGKPDGARAPYGMYKGMTIFEAAEKGYPQEGERVAVGYLPTEAEWRHPNIYEDTAVGAQGKKGRLSYSGDATLPEHKVWFFYLQRLCNHCTYPACVAACPRKAIYKREEDGIVLIDQSRCRGYKKCMEACPYKKPMYRAATRVTEKCIACYPRVEGKDPMAKGEPMETRCMSACVGKIRLQGLVPIAENGQWKEERKNPLYFLTRVEQVALPLYPQLGTEPNIYYIPPRWVPRQHLRQMFGPGVDDAIERYTHPSRELLAVLQLFKATNKILFSYEIKDGPKVSEIMLNGRKHEIYKDVAIGYGRDGQELARVSVEEDVIERPKQYLNSI